MTHRWEWLSLDARTGLARLIETLNRRLRDLAQSIAGILDLQYGPEVVYAHRMPGKDWGEKIAAALDRLPVGGGTVDATYLTGPQSLSADLTLDVPYVTIRYAKDLTLTMGSSRILVAGGTHGVHLQPEGGTYGTLSLNGAYLQPQFVYTGSGSAFVIGDSTTVTYGFVADDLGVRINGAGTGAVAITLNAVLYWHLYRPTILGSLNPGTTQVGIRLDGTHASLFCGWGTIHQPVMGRIYRAFHGTGSGVHTANAITILGGSVQGANNYASGTSGKGLYLEGGKGWFVDGLDIDNFERAVECNTANNLIRFRDENCDQGIYLDSGSDANWIVAVRDDGTTPVDLGTHNVVWQAGVQYGDHTLTGGVFAGGDTSAFGGSAGSSFAMLLKAAAGTTRVQYITSGNTNLWGWGANTSNDWFLQNYDGAGALIDKPLGVTNGTGGPAVWSRPNVFPASTAGLTSIRVPHGTAPSSPVDGDIWTTTAGAYVRINGVTVGPLGTGGGGGGGSGWSAISAVGL